jgi:molybdopterin-containing oxidoreductase family membrane subunit
MHSTHSLPVGDDVHAKDYKVQLSVHGEELDSKTIIEDVSRGFFAFGTFYKLALLALLAVFAVGIVAFVIRAGDGLNDANRHDWGYLSAAFAFIVTTAGSAPLVSVALRLTRNHWRRPISRIAELYAVVGLLSLLMFIPLLRMLPPIDGRRTLWFTDEFPGAPVWWQFFGLLGLVVAGLTLLFVSALPDWLQTARRGEGFRAGFARVLAGKWAGTESQWKLHRSVLAIMGAFYFLLLIVVVSLINTDFVMSLVPGWKDAIMPAHQALTGIQAGLALVLITAFLVRTFGGYKKYFPMEVFWSASKILMALCLLWAYFWFAAFMTFWYGRMPVEQTILKTFMFESYFIPFLINIFGNWLIPFFGLLMWNPVRKSVWGPTLASCFILVGSFFMMVRLYVPAFNIEDVTALTLETVPAAVTPNAGDVLMIIGAISGALFLYMLAAKFIPIISIWEMKEALLYQRVRTLFRSRFLMVGKPD